MNTQVDLLLLLYTLESVDVLLLFLLEKLIVFIDHSVDTLFVMSIMCRSTILTLPLLLKIHAGKLVLTSS